MKLDESIMQEIFLNAQEFGCISTEQGLKDECNRFWSFLKNIDLVVKPGDSSQSVLVENKDSNL